MATPGTLYLPSYANLRRHPKIRRLAKALNVSIPQAIGHMHCLWWFAMETAPDGDLSRVTDEDIALAAEWDDDPMHFVSSAQSAGFLDTYHIHDWEDYAGRFLQKRERDRINAAERQRRKRSVTRESRHVTRESHDVTRESRHVTHNKEEIREEKIKEPIPKPVTGICASDDTFTAFWTMYPRKENKKKSNELWTALKPEERAAALDRLPLFLPQYAADDPQFIPMPTTWINGRRWEDEPKPVGVPKKNGKVDMFAVARKLREQESQDETVIEAKWSSR